MDPAPKDLKSTSRFDQLLDLAFVENHSNCFLTLPVAHFLKNPHRASPYPWVS